MMLTVSLGDQELIQRRCWIYSCHGEANQNTLEKWADTGTYTQSATAIYRTCPRS